MRRQVMRPFRAPRQVIKETQEVEMENVGRDVAMQRDQPQDDCVHRELGKQCTIEARKEGAVSVDGVTETQVLPQVPSPSLSDFVAFLENLETKHSFFSKDSTTQTMGPIAVPPAKTSRSATDEYWENILQREIERQANDLRFTMVPVEDIMLDASSDEDDVPIVNTINRGTTNLGMLATVASEKQLCRVKTKKVKQTRWTYETVCEPTGVASKYWDANAPSERATKRLAVQRLSAIKNNNAGENGNLLFHNHDVKALILPFLFNNS